jgi:membrane-bound lytic murein transglycosylase B
LDGDGRLDLVGSPADAIGSVGRFLNAHGWIKGQPTHTVLSDTQRTLILDPALTRYCWSAEWAWIGDAGCGVSNKRRSERRHPPRDRQ